MEGRVGRQAWLDGGQGAMVALVVGGGLNIVM